MRQLSMSGAMGIGLVLWAVGFGYSRASAGAAHAPGASPPASHGESRSVSSSKTVPARETVPTRETAAIPEPLDGAAVAALAASYAAEKRGDFSGALRTLKPIVEANPRDYFLRLRLAYLLLSSGQFGAAAKDYALAAKLNPSSIEAMLGQQQALIAARSYLPARRLGEEILARAPGNYLARSRLAWTLFNLRRYAEAEAAYAALVREYPADLEMALGLGYTELRLGKRALAAARFKQLAARVPDDKRAQSALKSIP